MERAHASWRREPGECKDSLCSRSQWCGDRDGGCGDTEPIVLGPQRPRFIVNQNQPGVSRFRSEYNDAEIDLATNTLSFPVQVTTTLGFSTSTYGWLALAGTIVSGMLGSGWIWKLLEAVKRRSETAKATVQKSCRPCENSAARQAQPEFRGLWASRAEKSRNFTLRAAVESIPLSFRTVCLTSAPLETRKSAKPDMGRSPSNWRVGAAKRSQLKTASPSAAASRRSQAYQPASPSPVRADNCSAVIAGLT